MLKDHQIKDLILKGMCKNQNSIYDNEGIAEFYKISKERATKLLEEIAEDKNCSKEDGYGRKKHQYKYNEDSSNYLEGGGYTRKARIEYWESFPTKRWFIYAPIAAVLLIATGVLLRPALERIWTPTAQSKDSTIIKQGNTPIEGKDTTSARQLDTPKAR
jgi:hypothetical protein